MTNAFILCDLVGTVQKCHAANVEGSSKSVSIDLTLDWTHQREKWHQKLWLKVTQNGI